MSLDFIQIIFEEYQREKCYDFATIHFNQELTPYFENSVIAKLVPELQSDLVGVCSWRLAQKRGDMFRLIDKSLTYDKLTKTDYDIAVLTPRSPTHQPLHMAANWHHPAWTPAFDVFKRFLRTELGIKVPNELTNAIYENHFVAKSNIYHDYVINCLRPAIQYMDNNQDVFLADAGYLKRKKMDEVLAYRAKTGRKDWPIGVFILERLFSIFIEGKGYKIISL